MIERAGPFISLRQRWILRQLKIKPLQESKLVTMASSAPEYRDYKHIDRCVAHDLSKLLDRNLIKVSVGGRVTLVSTGAVAEAASAAQAQRDRASPVRT